MSYYFSTTLSNDFDEAMEKVTEGLKKEGFGILTEIDVKETFKKKLDVNFRKYHILGACNPEMALKAIQSESHIGTMLPCNVVVQELEDGRIEISAVDPMASMQAVENNQLSSVAKEVRNSLKSVIQSLK